MSQAFITFDQVSARVRLGRTNIYARIAAGVFPRQVKIGKRSLWAESEIDAWISEHTARRDMGQKMGGFNSSKKK